MGKPKSPMPPNIILGDCGLLQATAPDFVETAKTTLARTEDCKFSPSGKKLAIAGFAKNKIMVFDVDIEPSLTPPKIRLTDYIELHSPQLNHPHGLDFVDDETLLIGNRGGTVTIFALPVPTPAQKVATVTPLLEITKAAPFTKLNSPGSVCVTSVSAEGYELVVCNNYARRVSHHIVSRGPAHKLVKSRVMLERGLRVPDGAALSANKALLAISNHLTHEVFIYDNRQRIERRARPQGRLKGVDFPHGLRFAENDTYMFVADAGLPFMRLYHSPDAAWEGEHVPIAAIRVMDDETFLKGHTNHQEGGLKGLDLSPDGKILATTCETQPLVFFDTARLLHEAGGAG